MSGISRFPQAVIAVIFCCSPGNDRQPITAWQIDVSEDFRTRFSVARLLAQHEAIGIADRAHAASSPEVERELQFGFLQCADEDLSVPQHEPVGTPAHIPAENGGDLRQRQFPQTTRRGN